MCARKARPGVSGALPPRESDEVATPVLVRGEGLVLLFFLCIFPSPCRNAGRTARPPAARKVAPTSIRGRRRPVSASAPAPAPSPPSRLTPLHTKPPSRFFSHVDPLGPHGRVPIAPCPSPPPPIRIAGHVIGPGRVGIARSLSLSPLPISFPCLFPQRHSGCLAAPPICNPKHH